MLTETLGYFGPSRPELPIKIGINQLIKQAKSRVVIVLNTEQNWPL